MIRLEKMTAEEFTVFNEINISELSKVFSLAMPEVKARIKAEKEQNETLPDGINTDGHFLFSIKECRTQNKTIGGIWFTRIRRNDLDSAFIFFIWVDPSSRNKGSGSTAMELIEQEVRRLGLFVIRLHVLKNNEPALKLYKKMGYKLFTDYEKYDETDPGMIMEKII
jgi:RimJ/RimL family protein N-acetyltransferase